jgi:amidase
MSDIPFMSATELTTAMRDGTLAVAEVLAAHIERIQQANPTINALVALDLDKAMDHATHLDRRWISNTDKGPLYGLPTAHKDILPTKGVRTTRGSKLFVDDVPAVDHIVVERMKNAGALTLGKTNVPEFGLGSHTFNEVYGLTRNPYDPTKSAGGSSGGAAAALAAGMIPIADGSDTGGSLRNPASFCNVVGLRPTPGRVPSWPETAAWGRLSVKGPMARTVEDTALLLSVLAGPDARSPMSLETPGRDFAGPLNADPRGVRLAWSADLNGLVPVAPDVVNALVPALQTFTDLGCHIEDTAPDLSGADSVFETLRAWQLEYSLGPLLDRHPDQFKPDAVWNIEQGRRLTGNDIGEAEIAQTTLHHTMRLFFQQYDFLITPVSQVAPFNAELAYPQEINGHPMSNYLEWMRLPSMISVTGCPAISVPAAFTPTGLPVGIQIVAAPRAEKKLLQIAHAFEQSNGAGARHPDCRTGQMSDAL